MPTQRVTFGDPGGPGPGRHPAPLPDSHPGEDPPDLWPNLFSVIDLVLVSALFLFRTTALVGLLLNSFLAFLGIIMMTDFSLSATLAGQLKVMPGQTSSAGCCYHLPGYHDRRGRLLMGLALYRAILAEK